MAARSRKLELDKKWREKIRTSMLINRLSNHVAGRIEMSSSQVRAAEVLLKKNLPDLSATDITGDLGVRHSLADVIGSIGKRAGHDT
jgi:hypothetical protein